MDGKIGRQRDSPLAFWLIKSELELPTLEISTFHLSNQKGFQRSHGPTTYQNRLFRDPFKFL